MRHTRLNSIFLALLGLTLGAASALAADVSVESARQIVAKIDQLRQPAGNLAITARIATLDDGKEQDANNYAIRTDGGGNALLEMLDVDTRGQKILSTAEGIWMYFPKTRRPIRLTPMQQLHGDAAIGDVLRARWSAEYTVASVDNSVTTINHKRCILIVLNPAQDGSTYQRVDLYVAADSLLPVQAAFYTFGGKLLKYASFAEPATVNGRALIARTSISNSRNEAQQKATVYTVSALRETQADKGLFTLHGLEVGR
jgi:hypothetical protein